MPVKMTTKELAQHAVDQITVEDLIRRTMSELGKRKSKKKAAAARENGKKGGRPKKVK